MTASYYLALGMSGPPHSGPYTFFRFILAMGQQPIWMYEGCLN